MNCIAKWMYWLRKITDNSSKIQKQPVRWVFVQMFILRFLNKELFLFCRRINVKLITKKINLKKNVVKWGYRVGTPLRRSFRGSELIPASCRFRDIPVMMELTMKDWFYDWFRQLQKSACHRLYPTYQHVRQAHCCSFQ